ncbi:integrin beta-PS-like [Pollicipes pollicipes]|uniref:integrin beta-PS-like n=1 Tax=Pollicipes pollicipes TaxID=41117 RepID=UPI001884D092|nr:integrin beta-PS-like [Pollicipes pollicipes]
MLLRLLFACAVLLTMTSGQDATKVLQENPCLSKQTCGECMQSPTCAWCAQAHFVTGDNTTASRCNRERNFRSGALSCDERLLKTWANQVTVPRDEPLSSEHEGDAGAGSSGGASGGSGDSFGCSSGGSFDAIQIAPQHVRMSLRVGEPQQLSVRFALAPNYPIDLYYLMDLSKSMEDDKQKLSTLGNLLALEMCKLTTNFRLGFGSFVDKVLLPYTSTLPADLEHPCDNCTAPYGFHNSLPLTTDIDSFASAFSRAKVSGNLDFPEGGFDAIMQAIVCKQQIGWRSSARRLLVFSTDAGSHYAGDGKLGGVVEPNDGECHLDEKGFYTHSDKLDYPSVSQINQKVKQNSINIIFAVTSEQRSAYDMLSQHIEASSAGTLSSDSSNVVQLVKEQHDAITSFVELKDNSTDFVRIRYHSACLGTGAPEETNRCDGLKIGQRVNFTVTVELVKCPADPAQWESVVEIRPTGLNESLVIHLTKQCQCDCERAGPADLSPVPECNNHGSLRCGLCACDEEHFGALCECSQRDGGGRRGDDRCRLAGDTGDTCQGRGECVCGQCQCFERSNPQEVVTGEFCQCDNFSCDRHEKLLCSGPDHGSCVCGSCECRPSWTGGACQCPAGNATCVAPGDTKPCSGNGLCECGKCVCDEGESGLFVGRYCEDCPTCQGKCNEYRACVECVAFDSGDLQGNCNCSHLLINRTDVVEGES